MAPITVEPCGIHILPFAAPFSAPLFSAGINFSLTEKRERGDLTRHHLADSIYTYIYIYFKYKPLKIPKLSKFAFFLLPPLYRMHICRKEKHTVADDLDYFLIRDSSRAGF